MRGKVHFPVDDIRLRIGENVRVLSGPVWRPPDSDDVGMSITGRKNRFAIRSQSLGRQLRVSVVLPPVGLWWHVRVSVMEPGFRLAVNESRNEVIALKAGQRCQILVQRSVGSEPVAMGVIRVI